MDRLSYERRWSSFEKASRIPYSLIVNDKKRIFSSLQINITFQLGNETLDVVWTDLYQSPFFVDSNGCNSLIIIATKTLCRPVR